MFAKDPAMDSGQFDVFEFFFLTHGNKQHLDSRIEVLPQNQQHASKGFAFLCIQWAESEDFYNKEIK